MIATRTPYYDDIAIGMKLPEVEQILTIPLMARWCGYAENLRRRAYDAKFAIEHAGIPGAHLSGSFSRAYLWQLLCNWVGPEGWVYKCSQRQAGMVHPGARMTFFGVVTEKRVENGLGYADLDIGLRVVNNLSSPDGSVPVPGRATVVLPIRGGRPVPYPFEP